MKKYLSRPENQLCADCKRPSPTWASLNIGVFVCIKCSGCHREIGVHITKIKSVELDLWPSKSLTDFAKINNEIANAYWEYDLRNFDFQNIRDNEIRLIEFIRDKYEFKRWAKPNVPDPMSLVISGRDLVKEFMTEGEAVKLYEKSQKPDNEKRMRHFNVKKNVKSGRSFGIVDKNENTNNNIKNNTSNNNINNNNINNNNINSNNNNNNQNQNINQNQENNQNQNKKKGFDFIKRKNNPTQNNNDSNINTNNNTNNIDLLGFGNDDLNINEKNNLNRDQNTNNINENNTGINNIFPMDIFSFGQQNNNNNDNNNTNNNMKNIHTNDIQINNQNINTESNDKKSGFPFIKNKKKQIIQNNNNNNNNNTNQINSLFEINKNVPSNNNNQSNIQNNTQNVVNPINTPSSNIMNQNPNVNKSNNSNNNVINLFESDQLVDLFNIETPTSDAVLNLSKNLINIYSIEKEEENNKNKNINNNPIPNTNSNYNVLNMNYPNININNYYPNNEQQQNKNKPMMNTNNYGMNPMMGFNYQPQGGYMNNNFGFWYGYNMNMNSNYMNMGLGINNTNPSTINTEFSYKTDLFNGNNINKEKEDEQKPILFNNNTFELNFKRDFKKEKEDPFKNLVDFK